MRRCLCLVSLAIVLAALILTAPASAQSVKGSFLQLAHSTIAVGQLQTITVMARDLGGKPLAGASGTANVRYPKRTFHYHLHGTDAKGVTSVSFHARGNMGSGPVAVTATLNRGALHIVVAGTFQVAAAPAATSTSTSTPTATATPTAPAGLEVVARAVPPVVTIPQPAFVVVFAHRTDGADEVNAPVDATEVFQGGSLHVSGITDDHGAATLELSTAGISGAQVVSVGIVVHSGNDVGTTSAQFTVEPAPPAATPTDIPVSTATDVPLATPTQTPVPTFPPTPTSTPLPTNTPLPTSTPTPTATSTPLPTPTSTPVPNCPQSQQGCMQEVLNLINSSRSQYSQQYGIPLAPLTINLTQTNGTAHCVGSIGHSQAMANTGSIWHTAPGDDPSNPQNPASFWLDICIPGAAAGENVGSYSGATEVQELQYIHQLMFTGGEEEDDPAFCQTHINHSCNIVSGRYSSVGIGIVVTGDTTYLTEDFIG